MKRILLLLALSGVIPVYSQVELEDDFNEENGEYCIFRVKSKAPGVYSVYLDVRQADNFGGPVKQVLIVSTPCEVFRLKQEDPTKVGRVGYRYWCIEGDAKARRDTNFVYRLPYSVHKNTVRAFSKINDGEQHPFITTTFLTDKRDTVYAARKGQVIRTEYNYDNPDNSELVFTTKINRVTIVHDDGTTANYLGVEKGGFLVREGDMVYPDTPIAMTGPFGGEGHGFFFTISYPVLTGEEDSPLARHYYRPVFATSEGEKRLENNTVYIAKADYGLITREMKGREKKKYEQSKAIAPARK